MSSHSHCARSLKSSLTRTRSSWESRAIFFNDYTAKYGLIHIEWQHYEATPRQVIEGLLDLKLRNHNRGQVPRHLPLHAFPVVLDCRRMVGTGGVDKSDQKAGVQQHAVLSKNCARPSPSGCIRPAVLHWHWSWSRRHGPEFRGE